VSASGLLCAAPFPLAGEAFAILCSLLWSVSSLFYARMHPRPSAAALNLGKNLSAALCFFVLLWCLEGRVWPVALRAETAGLFALSGFVGLTLCDILFLRCLLDIGPQRAGTIFLTVPGLAALGALFPPFRETPPAQTWVGMLVCVAGIALALRYRPSVEVDADRWRRGVRAGLLAALLQTAGLLITRHAAGLEDRPALEGAAVRLLGATAGQILLGLLFVGSLGRWLGELAWERGRVALWVFVAAFLGTFLGIWTNQLSLTYAQFVGVAAMLGSLMPVFMIPLSRIYLGERFPAGAWIGTLIALAGMALVL
jgi:drug/metabolite transporter (DMT)-like permease